MKIFLFIQIHVLDRFRLIWCFSVLTYSDKEITGFSCCWVGQLGKVGWGVVISLAVVVGCIVVPPGISWSNLASCSLFMLRVKCVIVIPTIFALYSPETVLLKNNFTQVVVLICCPDLKLPPETYTSVCFWETVCIFIGLYWRILRGCLFSQVTCFSSYFFAKITIYC